MGIFNNLGKWQNYVHYLILTLGIFGIHYLSDIWGVEALVVEGIWYGWIVLFLFYAFGIFLADTIIHILFTIAPEPIKWED
jgi:hypothetical protein